MKTIFLCLQILILVPFGACQTVTSELSTADKAKQYYEDGLACYKKLDFLCSMQLLEQVWHLDDYSKIDVRKWTYYTAQSNFLVAIDKEALYPFARKVQSAERAEAMYKLLGEAFDEKRLVSQYFIINAIDDACDPRRRSAVERFKETDLATKDVAEFDELKDQISQLLIDNPDC